MHSSCRVRCADHEPTPFPRLASFCVALLPPQLLKEKFFDDTKFFQVLDKPELKLAQGGTEKPDDNGHNTCLVLHYRGRISREALTVLSRTSDDMPSERNVRFTTTTRHPTFSQLNWRTNALSLLAQVSPAIPRSRRSGNTR